MSIIPQNPQASAKDPTATGKRRDRLRYPHKVFSLAEHHIPKTVKELFPFCRYYYQNNPVLSQTITKSAEYPITDIIIETQDANLKYHYENLLNKQWKIRHLLIDIGINYLTFGNAFVSIYFSKTRFAKCPHCSHMTDLKTKLREKETHWRSFRVIGPCNKCKAHHVAHTLEDIGGRNSRFLSLVHWSPQRINISHNEITGENTYYYTLSPMMRHRIRMGDPDTLATTPKLFIDAVEQNKSIRLNPKNIFHFPRPGMTTEQSGWGMPMPLPALQELFHRGTLRRAEEAIALEHAVPWRFLYPEGVTGNINMAQTVNLGAWAKIMEEQITKMKNDPNHVAIFPVSVGSGYIGGDARSLFVTSQLQQTDQNIIAASMLPIEMVWGGLSWSGSSVSLRMVENHFQTYRDLLEDFLTFLITNVSTLLNWTPCTIRMAEFKMADDQARRDYMLQLNQLGKLSDETLFDELSLTAKTEKDKLRREMKEDADIKTLQARVQAYAQAESDRIIQRNMMQLQNMLSQIQGTPTPRDGGPAPMGSPSNGRYNGMLNVEAKPEQIAAQYAHSLSRMDATDQAIALQQLAGTAPQFYGMVQQHLGQIPPPGHAPLPEKAPPRRENALI